jgi:hypothetical protein
MADDAVGIRRSSRSQTWALGSILGRHLLRAASWLAIGKAGRRPSISDPEDGRRDSAGGAPWWVETSMSGLSTRNHIPPARKTARRPACR